MSVGAVRVLGRMTAVMVVAGGGFLLFQHAARHWEAEAATALLRLTGADGVRLVAPSAIEVVPAGHAPFRAIVTPTCSSVASVLAIAALATLAPARRWRAKVRRTAATVVAVATVVVGNAVRIAASLAVGLVAGRTSLILFHDWVGSVFGFAYTLGGYILLLYLLLPPSPQPATPATPVTPAAPVLDGAT